MFSQYTVPQLKSIIKQYNIHTKISNYSKLKKEFLLLEIEKYLTINDNKITVKENNFDIIVQPEKNIKNEDQLLSLGDVLKLIKKLERGDIGEDKKSSVKSLIYSLHYYKNNNYSPENKTYSDIYKFLGTNLKRLKLSIKQEKIIEKYINIFYTQQEKIKEQRKKEKIRAYFDN